jgi:hypothetical protein
VQGPSEPADGEGNAFRADLDHWWCPMTTCPRCASSDVVGFDLAPRGEPVRFTHCRGCEHRWWQEVEEAAPVPLGTVLDRIATRA